MRKEEGEEGEVLLGRLEGNETVPGEGGVGEAGAELVREHWRRRRGTAKKAGVSLEEWARVGALTVRRGGAVKGEECEAARVGVSWGRRGEATPRSSKLGWLRARAKLAAFLSRFASQDSALNRINPFRFLQTDNPPSSGLRPPARK